MNTFQFKNNTYKNGEYDPSYSKRMVKDNAKSIEPSVKQLEYRDALYKFCVQKGLVREGFKLGRTKQNMRANISALIGILRRNGLMDEFVNAKPQKG